MAYGNGLDIVAGQSGKSALSGARSDDEGNLRVDGRDDQAGRLLSQSWTVQTSENQGGNAELQSGALPLPSDSEDSSQQQNLVEKREEETLWMAAAYLSARDFVAPDGKIDHEKVKKTGGHMPTLVDQFVPEDKIEQAMAALASVESGGNVTGRIRYGAIGPLCPRHVTGKFSSRVDGHALGGFQVMAENVAGWAREAGFPGTTPEQFLADSKLQRDIVKHQVGKILRKGYGVNDLASIWHSGRPLADAIKRGVGDGINSTPHYAQMVAGHYKKLEAGVSSVVAREINHEAKTGHVSNVKALKTGELGVSTKPKVLDKDQVPPAPA